MLHLQPQPILDSPPRQPYAEAVARLASVRHALRLVDDHAGGPAGDVNIDEAVATVWGETNAARRALFDRRSGQTVAATAAGVEALLANRGAGFEPHAEASRTLVEEIRRELAAVSRAVLR